MQYKSKDEVEASEDEEAEVCEKYFHLPLPVIELRDDEVLSGTLPVSFAPEPPIVPPAPPEEANVPLPPPQPPVARGISVNYCK